MAETLSVAMRVAEEAIDEAISKAEVDTSSQVVNVSPSSIHSDVPTSPLLKLSFTQAGLH